MAPIEPIAVIGAGFAGLTAARTLADAGLPFCVYEATDSIAGLARSFRSADGFISDFGAHLITNRLAKKVGAAHLCRTVRRFGESVWIDGRARSYPFGLLLVDRFRRGAVRALWRSRGLGPPKDCDAALRREMGDPLADEVAIPVLESLSGVPAKTLSASAARRLPHPVRALVLRMIGAATGRVPAIGYTLDLSENPFVWHVYPEGGVETLCRVLAKGLEDRIRLSAKVERIIVRDEKAVAVVVEGQKIPAAAVISTMPVDRLAAAVEGTDRLRDLSSFAFSAMIFVDVRMRGRGHLPNVVLWTPDRRSLFYRLTEPPAGVPFLAPPDRTFVTADIVVRPGDGRREMPDELVIERVLADLEKIVPGIRGQFISAEVRRTGLAYPILDRAGEAARCRLSESTGVAGLITTGRNGEFAHILMEDVHHRTTERTKRLIEDIRAGAL